MLLLRRGAALAATQSRSRTATVAHQARSFTAAAGGKGGGGPKKTDDAAAPENTTASVAAAAALKEKDPFGFRELKVKYKGADAPGADFPNVREEELAAAEEEMAKTGKVTLPPNVFGMESIHKELTEAWDEGVLPPQLYPPESAEAPGLESPEDLYWPGNVETVLPRDSERLYGEGGERVFAPEELREMYEADIGGVCAGKKQRRGNQPLLCKKVDLEDMVFTNVAKLAQFLSPVGLIKPRRVSGLCAKCQRKVARTVKQARHMGMLPHTSGVDLYQRIKVEGGGGGDVAGPLLSRRKGGAVARESGKEEVLKKIPSVTI